MSDTVVEPISESLQQQVVEQTYAFIAQAEHYFNCEFKRIPVAFDLIGLSVGMFVSDSDGQCIRYNPWIFAKYFEENLRDTVPHEVAHYIVACRHAPKRGRKRVKPHGPEWQQIMQLFGANPQVTCEYDFTGVPQRRQQRYVYYCECREHEVSATVHNRIQRRRAQYVCQYCDAGLRRRKPKSLQPEDVQTTVKEVLVPEGQNAPARRVLQQLELF